MALIFAIWLALGMGAKKAPPTPFAQQGKLALRSVKRDRVVVPRYARVEFTLDLSATYDNPFDPAQMDVAAVFTSPNRKAFVVNGFLDQPFTHRLAGDEEKISASGKPVWKVRFAPDTVGTWRYQIRATDKTGTVRLPAGTFRVTPSNSPGFVGRSAANPAVFAFANGRPYFAVGENMGWAGKRGSYEFEEWLTALGRARGNWIRVWMCPWNAAIEWTPGAGAQWRNGDYHGLGVYSLDNAWKLDRILDSAERHGVYVMLCFGTYGEFTSGGFFNEGLWAANPYNAANGGPCAKPEDFWTNATARKIYRQRLRYIAARWGARTNIQAWEFWNETNPPAEWVAEMARYMKGTGEFQGHPADPQGHLVSTSYGSPAIWRVPEIDFTMTHHYGEGNIPDHAAVVYGDARQHAVYRKPHLMAEFGIDWRDSDSKYDPNGQGVNLHNGLWASIVGGNAGGAMLWWWDSYVHPKNVYAPFTALRKFTDTIPWTHGAWKPIPADAPHTTSTTETFSDLVLPANSAWGHNPTSDFTVTPRGLSGNVMLTQFLYSPGKPDLRTTPTFHVNFRQPGRFAVRVEMVSDTSRIRFLLDGKLAHEFLLSATPSSDPNVTPLYEKTEYKKEYNVYQAAFNKEIGIEVPPGEHTITLDNAEGDWASLSSITLTGYHSSRYPDVNTYALSDGDMAILWAQNARHNWKNVFEKQPIAPIPPSQTALHGLPAGRYRVEWWDTERGVPIQHESATCTNGALPLTLPALSTDIAARITRETNTASKP